MATAEEEALTGPQAEARRAPLMDPVVHLTVPEEVHRDLLTVLVKVLLDPLTVLAAVTPTQENLRTPMRVAPLMDPEAHPGLRRPPPHHHRHLATVLPPPRPPPPPRASGCGPTRRTSGCGRRRAPPASWSRAVVVEVEVQDLHLPRERQGEHRAAALPTSPPTHPPLQAVPPTATDRR